MASNTGWQQHRKPDEVPTPVAVAVSDFCRRARAQASAHEVREALALIPEQDDFRIRALTDGEPEATPLGPFAVVDILRGTPPQTAALRQGCGYYELVQAYVQLQREAAPAPSAAEAAAPSIPAAPSGPLFPRDEGAGAGAANRDAKEKAPKQTVAERIAPRKREPELPEPEAAEDSPFRKRELPAPRGRFTRVEVQKLPVDDLFAASGSELLSNLMEQHRDRMALAGALSRQYQGRGGTPVTLAEVTELLTSHRLLPRMLQQEREVILGAYTEHRGATSRVAWALGVSPSELSTLVEAAEVKTEVAELRERAKREALAPNNLSYRLDLLGRSKYLSDLGISRKFSDSLVKDLRGLLRAHLGAADTVEQLVALAAKRNGVSAELLARAVERLELAKEFQALVSDPTRNPLP